MGAIARPLGQRNEDPEIAKMEARLKVEIVLIPNKFIETPHYHVERLRHDDPRLDESKASFERAESPTIDTPYSATRVIESVYS